MKPKTFSEAVFDFELHLLVPCTPEQFSAYVLKLTGETYSSGPCHGVCFSTAEHVIIGLISWNKTAEDIATLSHEVTHAAHHSLALREIPLCPATEEVYAYLQGSLLRRCLQMLGVK